MTSTVGEEREIDQFLTAIVDRYGYDFRDYARASLTRRVRGILSRERLGSLSELRTKAIHSEELFARILDGLTVTVTEMFRDPSVYRMLRDEVFPYLETYPELKIWHPGCSTGEEAYSIAILLGEADLYRRSLIYATDINQRALSRAREGILSGDALPQATRGYEEAGGRHSLSRYYTADYGAAILAPELKKNILFSDHNLVTDGKFGEMNLVLCRNVLIYFNPTLQERVLSLLWESLGRGGFLCLGSKERLDCTAKLPGCHVVAKAERIYQKKS